jgi:signal transduction histidine kinase
MLALFAGAVILAQLVSFSILNVDRTVTIERIIHTHVTEGMRSVLHLLDELPPELHAKVLHAASQGRASYQLSAEPALGEHQAQRDELAAEVASLIAMPLARVRVYSGEPPAEFECRQFFIQARLNARERWSDQMRARYDLCVSELIISVDLEERGWLNGYADIFSYHHIWAHRVLQSLGLTLLLTLLVGVYLVRRLTGPLKELSLGSAAVGRGETVPPIAERGPQDVCTAISAFNTMQNRVQAFGQDRSRLLAAISHDLRSPITSMRLRVEFMEEGEDKRKMLATLAEMEAITSATLDFLRESSVDEQPREVDLNALLMSVCEDLADSDNDVSYEDCGRVIFRARTLALKRALVNIIDNAVKYGDSAQVSLNNTDQSVEILVSDLGPGVEAKDAEKVFEPFVRLEHSRNRETGGIGLGLSIARTIVRSHGGDIELLPALGAMPFTVRVILPRQ